MTPTLKDLELLKSHNKRVRMRIRLLDSTDYTEVSNITGKVVSASCDKSNDSDIRVTCSLTLSIPIKEQIEIDFEKTWNKRMVELFCGLYDRSTSSYREYSLGRMLMKSGNTTIDIDTQEIKLDLVDLMASITPERGSQIGSDTHIPSTAEGVNIRTLLINILGEFGVFKRYDICEFDSTLPHDIDFSNGIYPIEMFQTILNLFPYYEMFYDENGVFTVRKIPTKVEDPVDIEASVIDDLLISESTSSNFSEIKNTTEIWGQELKCDYAATSCTLSGSTYTVTVGGLTTLVDGETFAVYPASTSVANQKMNIDSLGEYGVYTMSGADEYTQIGAGDMLANIAYSIRYNQNKYVLVGELQVRCIVQEIVEEPSSNAKSYYKSQNNCNNVEWVINPDSTYACTLEPTTGRITGEIKQVLSGGEYDDIYSTDLAYERGRYENWRKCRLQDKVTIEMILVPWMDVNQKIRFTSPVSGELTTWIVQSISYNFEQWTMDVTASRFYPYYPW